MSIIQALILGIIQGVTELLPISSSAHLTIVPWLLGWTNSESFERGFTDYRGVGDLMRLLRRCGTRAR